MPPPPPPSLKVAPRSLRAAKNSKRREKGEGRRNRGVGGWNIILQEHIQKNIDALLPKQPNALVLITGDFNPNSTGFQAKHIAQVNHLKQLVTFKTRDSGILDWYFTNRPKLFTVSQLPKVGSSDHYTILAKPVTAPASRPVVNKVKIRDMHMRDSAWRALGRWITQKDWTPNLNAPSYRVKINLAC